MEYCIVYTTVPNDFTANLIATTLVDEKLAACVNTVRDVSSVYKWDNSLQSEDELLVMIKTKISLFDKVEARIKELHENTLPEIIAIPVIKGSKEYLNWLSEETQNA